MNFVREQKPLRRAADLGAFDIKIPKKGSPRQPPAIVTYQPVEVQAEYGCVDWYQYQFRADAEETRH